MASWQSPRPSEALNRIARPPTRMKVLPEQICPLLGTRADRSMHFGYPTRENQCYAHNRVSPLALDEQETYCLGGNHVNCRFYLAHQSREHATQKAEESLSRVSTPK